jgi:hypothetical protein
VQVFKLQGLLLVVLQQLIQMQQKNMMELLGQQEEI